MCEINPGCIEEEIGELELSDISVGELRSERRTRQSTRSRTVISVFTKGDAGGLRARFGPLLPSSSLHTGVEVGVNICNSGILVPGSSERDLRHGAGAGRRGDFTLIEYETSSGGACGSLIRCEIDAILVGRDGCVQEVTRTTSPNHVNVTLNISVAHEKVTVDQESVLVSFNLAACSPWYQNHVFL